MNMCVIVISCLSAALADIYMWLARKHGAASRILYWFLN